MITRKGVGLCRFCKGLVNGLIVRDAQGVLIRGLPKFCDEACRRACDTGLDAQVNGERSAK